MDFGIRGKRAFVSGSSSGLGRAIAIGLAREGCTVVVHGRDKPRTEQTAHDVEALGVQAVVTLGDLATESGCETVAKDALAALGGIDIVVNNTGWVLRKDNPPFWEIPFQTWIDSYEVNFMSTLRMSTHFLPGIREKGWGRFVNISSGGAVGTPIMPEYGSAKAALNKLTADMAKTVGQFGATANTISPGVIRSAATEEWIGISSKQRGWTEEEFEQKYLEEQGIQPIPRFGRPEDIANAAVFLSSQQAEFITGVVLNINGGSSRTVYM